MVNPAGALVKYGFNNIVTSRERAFNNQVFNNAEKTVKKTPELRNSDYGIQAAQTCLYRDLVEAPADEAGLIMKKIEFLDGIQTEHVKLDTEVGSYESRYRTDNKCDLIRTRSEAAVTRSEAAANKTEYVRAVGEAAKNTVDGVGGVIKDTTGLVSEVKNPIPLPSGNYIDIEC